MGKAQERAAALSALVAAGRTQKAAGAVASASFTSIMSGVSVNVISSQNITDLTTAQTNWNAALTALDVAIAAVNSACRAVED